MPTTLHTAASFDRTALEAQETCHAKTEADEAFLLTRSASRFEWSRRLTQGKYTASEALLARWAKRVGLA